MGRGRNGLVAGDGQGKPVVVPRQAKGTPALMLASAMLTLSTTGCQTAMSAPTDSNPHSVAQSANDPIAELGFVKHNFTAIAFNTYGCSVEYYGRYQIDDRPDKFSGGAQGADYREGYGSGVDGIPAAPASAIVKWKSLDGSSHEASVDFNRIFKGGRVLHQVHESEIPPGWIRDDVQPTIVLEVNDRTITVLMRAHVGTREEQVPGNKYSTFKDDLIEAWKQTY